MATSNTTNISTSLLQVLFIGLKLTGHIDWSWWWVLSPTLIPLAFVLLIFFVIFIAKTLR